MFRKRKKLLLDSWVDSALDWFGGPTSGFTAGGQRDWFDARSQSDTVVEEKQQEFFLFFDDHLVKIKFEAFITRRMFRLRATILELDGRPILTEEQEKKAVEITQPTISEDDQRILVATVLTNFGVRVGQKMGVVTDGFAQNYARFLRMRNHLDQKV